MGVAGGRLFLRLFFGNRGSRRKTLPNSVSLLSCGAVQRASGSAPTPQAVGLSWPVAYCFPPFFQNKFTRQVNDDVTQRGEF